MVEPDVSSGDYLHGFYLGTRQALAENDRESVTITVKEVSPFTRRRLDCPVSSGLWDFMLLSSTSMRIINQEWKLARRPPARSFKLNANFGIPFQTTRQRLQG